MNAIELPYWVVKGLVRFVAARGDMRPDLERLHLTSSYIEATDGAKLMRWQHGFNVGPVNCLIDAPEAFTFKGTQDFFRLAVTPERVLWARGGMLQDAKAGPVGRFGDSDRLVADALRRVKAGPERSDPAYFDSGHMLSIARTVHEVVSVQKGDKQLIRIEATGPESVAVVRSSDPRLTILIMPVKVKHG